MMSGSVWTERKARTGELTPPTRSFSARVKISRERGRESLALGCGAVIGDSRQNYSSVRDIVIVFGGVGASFREKNKDNAETPRARRSTENFATRHGTRWIDLADMWRS